jgi:hypothetical protein
MPKTYSVNINITATAEFEVELTDEEMKESAAELIDDVASEKAVKQLQAKIDSGDWSDLDDIELEVEEIEEIEEE